MCARVYVRLRTRLAFDQKYNFIAISLECALKLLTRAGCDVVLTCVLVIVCDCGWMVSARAY